MLVTLVLAVSALIAGIDQAIKYFVVRMAFLISSIKLPPSVRLCLSYQTRLPCAVRLSYSSSAISLSDRE